MSELDQGQNRLKPVYHIVCFEDLVLFQLQSQFISFILSEERKFEVRVGIQGERDLSKI